MFGTPQLVAQLERVAELERMNAESAGQLLVTANACDQPSGEDEIATLKAQVVALSEEKLEVEWKLARERQKTKARKNEAKERRQIV